MDHVDNNHIIFIPGTQMGPLVLIGVWALFWGGGPSKIEVIGALGIYIYIQMGLWAPGDSCPFIFSHFFRSRLKIYGYVPGQ